MGRPPGRLKACSKNSEWLIGRLYIKELILNAANTMEIRWMNPGRAAEYMALNKKGKPMLVKVCPKCGAESKTTSASCSNCYASLADVPETVSQKSQEPTAAQQQNPQKPPAQAPPEEQAETGAAGLAAGQTAPVFSGQQPGQTQQTPPSPYGPPPGAAPRPPSYGQSHERSQPARTGSSAGIIALVLIVLAGAAFGGWWFFMRSSGPEQVVERFMAAAKSGDFAAFKSCLSESSVSMFNTIPGGEEKIAEEFKKQGGGKDFDGKILKTSYEGNNAIVEISPADASKMPPSIKTVDIVLVKESKEWKIDLEATVIRMMQKAFKGMPQGGFGKPGGAMPGTGP